MTTASNAESKTASQALGEYAVGLRYEQIPSEVIWKAKESVIDSVAASVFGSQMPWSRTVADYAQRNSAPGECSIFGTSLKVRAPFACLANGASVHAFELDCLSEPSVGIHPSANVAVPVLAPAQGRKLDGKKVLTAVVAGYEVLYRIGHAANNAIEKLGLHAPAIVGPYGTAAVIGRMFDISATQMAHAFGIAGSTSAGLMEFSSTGGMVKRLHLGRAAEAGFMAAVLAREGYTGPAGVLDGRFGFLNAYCRGGDPARLTNGFGTVWHTLKSKLKRYACHSTGQVPVTLALELKAQHKLSGDDIAGIAVAINEKAASQNAALEPRDLTVMQYSVPFCVAMAFYKDPLDPSNFSEATLNDPKIRALSKGAKVEPLKAGAGFLSQQCRVTVKLKDGRELSLEGNDHKGTPTMPLTPDELRDKFLRLTAHKDRSKSERLFEQLAEAERVKDFSTLDFAL